MSNLNESYFNMSFPVSFIRLVAGNLTINHKKYLIYLKTSASQACGESISFWNKSPIVLITTAQRAGKLFYTLVSSRTSVYLEKVWSERPYNFNNNKINLSSQKAWLHSVLLVRNIFFSSSKWAFFGFSTAKIPQPVRLVIRNFL